MPNKKNIFQIEKRNEIKPVTFVRVLALLHKTIDDVGRVTANQTALDCIFIIQPWLTCEGHPILLALYYLKN